MKFTSYPPFLHLIDGEPVSREKYDDAWDKQHGPGEKNWSYYIGHKRVTRREYESTENVKGSQC